METLPILLFIALTSVGAYRLGVKRLGLRGSGIQAAIGKVLEGLGLTLVFLLVNVAIGATVILAVRALTPSFLSLYLAAPDDSLLVLSLLQALTFQAWRGSAQPESGNAGHNCGISASGGDNP